MSVFELVRRCGNYIDTYRIIKPNGDFDEYSTYTIIPDMYGLTSVVSFQIEKIAGQVVLEVVL